MAIFRTEDTKGKKEDLASFITMITRDETPFLSSIGNKKATAVFHEWQTDELAAPAANAQAEGSDFSASAGASPPFSEGTSPASAAASAASSSSLIASPISR